MPSANITISVDGASIATDAFHAIATEAEKVSPALRTVSTEGHGVKDSFAGIADQVAGMFTVGAIIGFGQEVLAAGSAIVKMSDQTGIGIGAIQKLQYIAGQSDTSVESLVSAIQNLQLRLGDDESGAAGALKHLNINFDDFRKLNAYDQMTQVADGVLAIKDPTEQVTVAAALFGRTWKEILPAIKAGMKDTGDQAVVMADDTVKSLDRIGDAQKASKQQAIAWGGAIVLALADGGAAWGDYFSKFNPEHFGATTSMILAQQAALNDDTGLAGALQKIPPIALQAGDAFKAVTLTGMALKDVENELAISAMNAEVARKAEAKATEEASRIEAASLAEATKLWDEYFALRVQHGGTANQIAIADIDQWASDLTAKMVKAGTDTDEFYAGLAAVSTEKLKSVGVDWDFLRANSRETLDEMARNARATYEQMITGSQHFSREVMDEQLAKVHEADDAARGMGKSYVDAFTAAADKAQSLKDKIAAVAAAAADAKAKMMAMGSTFTYDLTTQAGVEQYRQMNTGMDISWSNDQLIAFAKQGGTLQQLLQMGIIHMRAFASGVENFSGGWAMVGEQGPEPMYVPPGASIYPTGTRVGGVGSSAAPVINVYLSGAMATDRVSFKQVVQSVFMEVARQNRLLPS